MLQPGSIIGAYKILAKLAAGGMATVYRARHLRLQSDVALKVLHQSFSADPEVRARFRQEARVQAQFAHPAIVRVSDLLEEDVLGIVMELVEGPTLLAALRKERPGPWSLADAVRIFQPVLDAVAYAHARGVVHRDLKPGNVMLDRSRGQAWPGFPRVADFGIAKLLSRDVDRTRRGTRMGTLMYMAPEQFHGDAEVDGRADVFALGMLLWRMLAGRLPADPREAAAVLAFYSGETPIPSLRELLPEAPKKLSQAVVRALSFDPARRPADARALQRLLGYEPTVLPEAVPVREAVEPEETRVLQRSSHLSRRVARGRQVRPLSGTTTAALLDEPFIGRKEELGRLLDEQAAALEGRGRIVLVRGEPGIGKTRLVERFAAEAEVRGARVLWGRFYDYGGSGPAPYETFARMLASHPDPASTQADFELYQQRETDRWRVLGGFGRAFEQLGPQPLLLLFDDVQWASRRDLELIEYLLQALAEHPVCIVATAHGAAPQRDAELERWLLAVGYKRLAVEISLAAFGEEEVRQWLRGSLGEVSIGPTSIRRLQRASAGNPFFLRELVRELLAKRELRKDDGVWVCGDLEQVALPDSVNKVVRARLSQLDAELVQMLEVAAVIGDEFRFDTLVHATGLGEEQLEQRVEAALHDGLVRELDSAGEAYRFARTITRDVLYAELPPRRKRRLHQRVVEGLTQIHERSRIPAVLCYHYTAVGDWSSALASGLQAAEEALAYHDDDTAKTCLERARRARERLDEAGHPGLAVACAGLDRLAAQVLSHEGRLREAAELQRRAEEIARAAAATSLRIDLLIDLAGTAFAQGDGEACLALTAQAGELAAAQGDEPRRLRAEVLRANAMSRQGRFREATKALDAVLASPVLAEQPATRSRALHVSSWAHMKQGDFEVAERLAHQALEMARRRDDPVAQQMALNTLGAIFGESGNPAESIRLYQKSLKLLRKLPMRRWEGICLANIGEGCFELERFAEAEDHFHEALAIFEEIGDKACEGDCRVNIGRVLLARERTDEGIAMLEQGRAQCEQTQRHEYAALAALQLGDAYFAKGQHERARTHYAATLATFDELHSHQLWRAQLGLARVEEVEGRPEQALQLARQAWEQVERQRSLLQNSLGLTGFERLIAPVAATLRRLEKAAG